MSSNAAMSVAFFGALASLAWSAAYAWAKWLAHRYDTPPAPGAAPPQSLAAAPLRLVTPD